MFHCVCLFIVISKYTESTYVCSMVMESLDYGSVNDVNYVNHFNKMRETGSTTVTLLHNTNDSLWHLTSFQRMTWWWDGKFRAHDQQRQHSDIFYKNKFEFIFDVFRFLYLLFAIFLWFLVYWYSKDCGKRFNNIYLGYDQLCPGDILVLTVFPTPLFAGIY